MKRFICLILVFVMALAGCQAGVEAVSSTDSSYEASSEPESSIESSSEPESSKETSSIEEVVVVLDDGYDGFITVLGKDLVDESGKKYQIKGMGFGNNISSNPSFASTIHHSEKHFGFLAEMGFNSVRFNINYAIFEDDENPYVYRDEGFEWLDKNIAWAKKYGIRLVLSMHYPQGGCQSTGEGSALWTEPENMKRLTALWTEIAKRYADEPTILGYGLINEPNVAVENTADAIDVYTAAVQGMVDSIREVNDTQIIFVEKIHTILTIETGKKSWPDLNGRLNFPVIQDDNIVYEFHFYNPLDYTHQWELEEVLSYPLKENGNTYDKLSIALDIKDYVDFAKKQNAPIYCGEFGVTIDCFKEGGNGLQWVSDSLDVFFENGVNFNYHTFHEDRFGLYMSWCYSAADKLNVPLRDLFTEKLK